LICFLRRVLASHGVMIPDKTIACEMDERVNFDRAWCVPYNYSMLQSPFGENELFNVKFSLVIQEIREVNDNDETIQIQMFLKRSWKERRILVNDTSSRWKRNKGVLTENLGILHYLWRPYITIYRLVDFKKHTVINDLTGIRVQKDKTVQHSVQALITLSCPMNFKMFPFDRHICFFMVGSYYDPVEDLTCSEEYNWVDGSEETLGTRMLQYDVELTKLRDEKRNVSWFSSNTSYAACGFEIHLKRKVGMMIWYVYLPFYFYVVVSWISFVVPVKVVPARLGGLMVVFLISINTFNSTKVTEPGAASSGLNKLDLFMITCILFIFGAIMSYTWILFLLTVMTTKKTVDDQIVPVVVGESGRVDTSARDIWGRHIDALPRSWRRLRKTPGFSGKLTLALIQPAIFDIISLILFPVFFIIFNILYWSLLIVE